MKNWFRKKKYFTKDFFQRKIRKKTFEIGDYTYGKPEIKRYGSSAKLKIGKYCSIAGRVRILLGGNHRTDWVTTYPFEFPEGCSPWPEIPVVKNHTTSKGDVVIGSDVWIGHGSMILSGVTVGDGAVIGACSVVTKDVPPYAVVAGNPARVLRKRFDDQTIQKLLTLRWWDWPAEKVGEKLHILRSPQIELLFENRPGAPEKGAQPVGPT